MSKLAWGYVLVVLAVLLWAGNAVIGRIAPDVNVPPLALNFWRWMVALLVLAPFAIPKLSAQRDLFRAHWRLWTVFGIVTVAGFNSAYYVGLQYTTVVQGTLISAVLPIFVLVAARVFLAQPITGRQLAGVAISIIGVAIIVVRGDFGVLGQLVLNIGDVWILAAVCMGRANDSHSICSKGNGSRCLSGHGLRRRAGGPYTALHLRNGRWAADAAKLERVVAGWLCWLGRERRRFYVLESWRDANRPEDGGIFWQFVPSLRCGARHPAARRAVPMVPRGGRNRDAQRHLSRDECACEATDSDRHT